MLLINGDGRQWHTAALFLDMAARQDASLRVEGIQHVRLSETCQYRLVSSLSPEHPFHFLVINALPCWLRKKEVTE